MDTVTSLGRAHCGCNGRGSYVDAVTSLGRGSCVDAVTSLLRGSYVVPPLTRDDWTTCSLRTVKSLWVLMVSCVIWKGPTLRVVSLVDGQKTPLSSWVEGKWLSP